MKINPSEKNPSPAAIIAAACQMMTSKASKEFVMKPNHEPEMNPLLPRLASPTGLGRDVLKQIKRAKAV